MRRALRVMEPQHSRSTRRASRGKTKLRYIGIASTLSPFPPYFALLVLASFQGRSSYHGTEDSYHGTEESGHEKVGGHRDFVLK